MSILLLLPWYIRLIEEEENSHSSSHLENSNPIFGEENTKYGRTEHKILFQYSP